MRSTADQDKEPVTGGFFQGLEQCVGCSNGQSIGLIDETNFPFPDERSIDELLFDLAYLLNLDLGRRCFRVGLDYETVRVGPCRNLEARSAVSTAVSIVRVVYLFTVQRLSQPYSGHPLSDSGLAMEQVGMGEASMTEACLEYGDRLFVACDVGEGHGDYRRRRVAM